MSLKRASVGTLRSKVVSSYKFSSNRLSLRRFPFPSAPAVGPSAVYVEDVFSTYIYTGDGVNGKTIQNEIQIGDSGSDGGSVVFDRSGDYFTIADSSALELGSKDFTVEMWLYSDEYQTTSVPLCKSGTTVYNPFLIYIADGNADLYLGNDSSTWNTAGALSIPSLPVNQWIHIAISRSGNTISAFLNGIPRDNLSYSSAIVDNSRDWYIGSRQYATTTNQPFGGYISNLRIVVGTALYSNTSSFTPSITPLTSVANTQLLIGQSPSPLTDYSPNSYTANVSGNTAASDFGPFTTPGSGNGGMVWIKSRSAATDHSIYDTVRGTTQDLVTNSTAAQTTQQTGLTVFNNNGFTIGSLAKLNTLNARYASWTFRKQPKFFDVVTYTGDGVAGRTVAHNLGSVPGCMIVKRTDAAGDWRVWHRSLTSSATNLIYLNRTDAEVGAGGTGVWNNTDPTSTVFSVSDSSAVNVTGGTYVAYLFAHDAGGFGLTDTDNVVSCGSFTSSTSAGVSVTLGYEPQLIIAKLSSSAGGWYMIDNMRGMPVNAIDAVLQPNSSTAENSSDYNVFTPTATGFIATSSGSSLLWGNSQTVIYIAIRRGPMKIPTSANTVFQPVVYTGTNVDNRLVPTNILTDMILARQRNSATVNGFIVGDRLRGNPYFSTGAGSAQVNDLDSLMTPTAGYGNSFSAMNGFGVGNDGTSQLNQSVVSNNQVVEAFARAPGFLDIVSYTGTGSARTISHNLGAVPKMMWIKNVSTASRNTIVYFYDLGANGTLLLTTNGDAVKGSSELGIFNDTAPTSSVFSVGTSTSTNQSADNHVAYLMGDVPGVSKVSYYIGKGVGNVNQIDCGFTNGARFVLIKNIYKTGTAGNWYVWDTARGIVSGNDPYLWTNGSAAEDTATDYIDTYAAGFELSATAPVALNEGYADDWVGQNIAGTSDINTIIYENNTFVAGADNGSIYYSANGYSWTARSSVVTGGVNDLSYGNGTYVAVGLGGRVSTSANLVIWSTRTSNVSSGLNSTTYGFGKFWAAGNSGTVISSEDGISWSNVSIGTASAVNSVRFLNNNLVFVGAGGFIITSSDGVNFTSRTSGVVTALNNSTYNNGLYIAVGASGVILTSTDLSTWTSRSSGALSGNVIYDVVWALNRFIAVASAGETGYSADGITWSTGAGAGGFILPCVAYGNDMVIAGNADGTLQVSNPRYLFWAIA